MSAWVGKFLDLISGFVDSALMIAVPYHAAVVDPIGVDDGRRCEGEGRLVDTPESKELLRELASRLNLPDTRALLEQNQVGRAEDLLEMSFRSRYRRATPFGP